MQAIQTDGHRNFYCIFQKTIAIFDYVAIYNDFAIFDESAVLVEALKRDTKVLTKFVNKLRDTKSKKSNWSNRSNLIELDRSDQSNRSDSIETNRTDRSNDRTDRSNGSNSIETNRNQSTKKTCKYSIGFDRSIRDRVRSIRSISSISFDWVRSVWQSKFSIDIPWKKLRSGTTGLSNNSQLLLNICQWNVLVLPLTSLLSNVGFPTSLIEWRPWTPA